MNYVVDTNIVFSAILNTNSRIAGVLTGFKEGVIFYSPAFLLTELDEHRKRLTEILKIDTQSVWELQHW